MWRMIALILLGVLVAGALYVFGLHIGPLHIAGLADRLAARDATIAQMRAAGEVKAAVATVITKGADDAHTPRLAAARAATVRYVDRVRTAPCSLPTETPAAPESPDGAGPTADMVAIRRDDLDILVENSVRLETVHEWGEKLIDDGLALDVEF